MSLLKNKINWGYIKKKAWSLIFWFVSKKILKAFGGFEDCSSFHRARPSLVWGGCRNCHRTKRKALELPTEGLSSWTQSSACKAGAGCAARPVFCPHPHSFSCRLLFSIPSQVRSCRQRRAFQAISGARYDLAQGWSSVCAYFVSCTHFARSSLTWLSRAMVFLRCAKFYWESWESKKEPKSVTELYQHFGPNKSSVWLGYNLSRLPFWFFFFFTFTVARVTVPGFCNAFPLRLGRAQYFMRSGLGSHRRFRHSGAVPLSVTLLLGEIRMRKSGLQGLGMNRQIFLIFT